MRASSGVYLSRIDHLRFLAATLVLWWHFAAKMPELYDPKFVPTYFPLSLFDEGHTGVSLFLVLSGFIFCHITTGRNIIYTYFMANRALRIAPLALFWMLLFFYIIPEIDPVDFVVGLLSTVARTDKTIPLVGWTLIVEWQFYLLFPFLLIFVRRYGASYLIGLIMLMIFIRLLIFLHQGSIQQLSYWTIFGRIDQFLLGMLACTLAARWSKYLKIASPFLLLFGILVAAGTVHLLNFWGGFFNFGGYPSKSIYWVWFHSLEGLGYAMLIIGYLALPIRLPLFIDKPLAAFGALSYSMYWCHITLLDTAKVQGLFKFLPADGLSLTGVFLAVVLPATLVVSVATYHLIEKPFLELRVNYFRPMPPPPPPAPPAPPPTQRHPVPTSQSQ